MRHFAIALTIAAIGCGVTEESWTQTHAQEMCQLEKECARGNFDSNYRDVADCVDGYEDAADDYETDIVCAFDEEEADRCISSLRKSTCEGYAEGDYYSDCDEVWDCAIAEDPDIPYRY